MTHPAEKLNTQKPVIFTAMSWDFFAYRMFVVKFVLEQGGVPINPFMSFDFFMLDTISRDVVREANNNLVRIADELWCFGKISDGVAVEIQLAKTQEKKIRFFKIEKPALITEVTETEML